jgi:hypothetical protein
VRIWGNTFHDVLVGISLAPTEVGPVYAIRNLIYNTGAGNNDYTGSPFKFNSNDGDSGAMYLFHNTGDSALPEPLSSGLDIKEPGNWQLIYSRNNIWSGTEYAIHDVNTGYPTDLDYDDLYTTQAGEFVYWGEGDDRHMRDLATFRSLTGQELHGLDAPPGFADASTYDYTLDPESDLVNAGVLIPGINDEYVGSAPDIGAFELSPSLELYGVSASQAIYLSWTVNATLPVTATWRIEYTGPTGDEPSPINDIPIETRTYSLTGLENYAWYDITLSVMLDDEPILSDTLRLMPTDRRVCLPLVQR